MDLQRELERVCRDVRWDVEGILHTDKRVSPLPAESRVVTEIFQSIVIQNMKSWANDSGVAMTDNAEFTRGYPDISIELDDRLIAVDIKSARAKKGDRISRMTLGTYNGYFLHPDEKRLHKKTRCYNDYHGHWIIAVIYEWHPKERTRDMVVIRDVCVGQKWQFAGRISGSGDTANIGGLNSLSRLQTRDSEFSNNEEFERYWRDYCVKHPRRGTKLPT